MKILLLSYFYFTLVLTHDLICMAYTMPKMHNMKMPQSRMSMGQSQYTVKR